MRSVRLHRHPSTPCAAVDALTVQVELEAPSTFALRYELAGDIGRVYVPARRTPTRRHGLFRHTCFEMFVRGDRGEGYCEFNFSPSGEWAAYAFGGYRAGMKELDVPQPPAVLVHAAPDALRLDARVPVSGEICIGKARLLRLAFAVVVEEAHGGLSYWAAAHASERPDFHHPEAFVVELAAENARP